MITKVHVFMSFLALIVTSLPPNMKTLQFDIEEPSWGSLMMDCDLVHMRLMLGSIHNDAWASVYRNALEYVGAPSQLFSPDQVSDR